MTTGCGCEEQQGLSRRGFMRGALAGAAAVAGGGLLDLGSAQVAMADPGYTGDTLVVISLRGGFDGLSAIVPLADPAYAALRPAIAVPASRAIPLDSTFGLHPALAPLQPLWAAGTFGAVHAVGQTDPTRSHFAAMEQLERAAPDSRLRTGWIDRMAGISGSRSAFTAMQLGSGTAGTAFAGPAPALAVGSLKDFSIAGTPDDTERARWHRALTAMYRDGPADVVAPAREALAAMDTVRGIPATAALPDGAGYPDTAFGRALADVARLIGAGIGVRVAAVDLGGWDMHQWLGPVDDGQMALRLSELAKGLAAFAADLGDAFARTSVVTLSEFGRRVEQNGSGGLDHGNGNAVLLLGGGLNGGRVHGRWPGLDADSLVDGDLAGTTDYRVILAEVLEQRCGISGRSVFPGLGYERLGVARVR